MVEYKPKPMNDGLEDYTLGKDYGHFMAGSVLRVDPERRVWLDAHGYGKKSGEVSISGGTVNLDPLPPPVRAKLSTSTSRRTRDVPPPPSPSHTEED